MRKTIVAIAVVLGTFSFAPTKAEAGVYIRAPYFSLNLARPYRPYYRPYRYRRPYYGRRYYKRRWRRRW